MGASINNESTTTTTEPKPSNIVIDWTRHFVSQSVGPTSAKLVSDLFPQVF